MCELSTRSVSKASPTATSPVQSKPTPIRMQRIDDVSGASMRSLLLYVTSMYLKALYLLRLKMHLISSQKSGELQYKLISGREKYSSERVREGWREALQLWLVSRPNGSATTDSQPPPALLVCTHARRITTTSIGVGG